MNKADKDKIRRNLVQLTGEMTLDEQFLMYMAQERILSAAQVEEFEALPTRARRASKMCMLIQKRGPDAFEILLTALILTCQDHLANLLDQELAQTIRARNPEISSSPYSPKDKKPYPQSGAFGRTDTNQIMTQPQDSRFEFPPGGGSGFKPSIVDNPAKESSLIAVNVQPVNIRDQRVFSLVTDQEDNYKMVSRQRGRAIIINNELFSDLPDRGGSFLDAVNLDTLLQQLHFTTDMWNNLTGQELLDKMVEESRHPDHAIANAFIMVVMSHGVKGEIYGTDGKKVEIEYMMTIFNGINCRGLLGKPKLFFIQACQGDDVTQGVTVLKADGASEQGDALRHEDVIERFKDLSLQDDTDSTPYFLKENKKHEKADMLLAYSTAPGYKSWRHPELGTWFVRELVMEVMENAYKDHLVDMLTRVRRKVGNRKTQDGNMQITHSDDFLMKKVYFFPGFSEQI